MNRLVLIPAVCCTIAFGAFYFAQSGMHGPIGDTASAAPVSSVDFGPTGVPASDAERLVRALGDQYQERYQSWAKSPHKIISRAGPTYQPPIQLEIEMSPQPPKHESNLATATISIRQDMTIQVVPCVVDAATQEIRLFQSGRWIPAQQWLDSAGRNAYAAGWQPKKPG